MLLGGLLVSSVVVAQDGGAAVPPPVEEPAPPVAPPADDAGAEEEPFNVITFVEIEGECDDFLGSEASAPDITGTAIDAVVAVVEADVREEDL